MVRVLGVVPAVVAFVVLAGPACAQIGNSDAPVEVTSRQGEYLQNEGRGVYTGDVVATQGDSQIKTDKLTVLCSRDAAAPDASENNSCEMEKLIAEGRVFYIAPDVRIRGDRAEYEARGYPDDRDWKRNQRVGPADRIQPKREIRHRGAVDRSGGKRADCKDCKQCRTNA